jgi:uncharacterized protein YaiL (DUF2058 family)
VIFVGLKYFQEYKKNIPYKKELENLKILIDRNQKENIEFQKQIVLQQDALSQEKERKDKFGESLEGEKVVIISDDLLKSILLPFLSK